MPDRPATPVPAASLLLLRDGPVGVEVFMVLRHPELDFSSGALVFPGGKIDPADHDPALRDHCAGGAALDPVALARRVAAVRELFEETFVLMARPRGGERALSAEATERLIEVWRKPIHDGDAAMLEMARAENIEFMTDRLAPFAHWITPEHSARRFDVHFFVARAPADQTARHDGIESVDSMWITPRTALDDAAAGRRPIVFPTRANLSKVGRAPSVDEIIERAAREPVATVMTRRVETPEGTRLAIPEGLGFELTEIIQEAIRTAPPAIRPDSTKT